MNKTVIAILFFSTALIAAAFIYKNPPATSRYYPPCIAKKITGYDCAGCGSARACYHLLHGNIAKAANHNLLVLFMLPVLAIGLLHFFTGKLSAAWDKLNKPIVFLIVIIFFWVARNIPVFPFEMLHSDR